MAYIRDFGALTNSDALIAGGKGASLGEMTRAGIPVPPGFVVTTDAFSEFLRETDLNVEIDAILSRVSHTQVHTIERASEEIQALILDASMPERIASAITESFRGLGAQYVAVRSSATAEDGATAAWAGQLDSFLNTTEDALLKNVQRCWASLFTPRAIFYRYEKELHGQEISVAVVVQKMVDSEAAGIAFSVHPVTEDYDQMIIEAGLGLAEAVVSGQVTPDSYVVRKSDRTIVDTNVAEQLRGLYRKTGGQNEWRAIDAATASTQVLSEEHILRLADIVCGIEKHYGFPVDVEWAMENGEIYIVQSRPITTLRPSASSAHSNEPTLSERFSKGLEGESIIHIEGEFLPLLILVDWLNFEDKSSTEKNLYPIFGYREKGKTTRGYFSYTRYLEAATTVLDAYLAGSLSIEERAASYQKARVRVEELYDQYFAQDTWSEEEALALLENAHQALRALVRETLFIEVLDRTTLEGALTRAGKSVRLSEVWEASQILTFPSFDTVCKSEILAANWDSPERLQHVFANYTHIPSSEEIRESLSKVDREELARELEERQEELHRNVQEHASRAESLTEDERSVLAFLDFVAHLRDERKILINKADVLLYDLIRDLYRLWGIPEEHVGHTIIFDVLKGREHTLSTVPALLKRRDKVAILYEGGNEYIECFGDEATEQWKSIDALYLSQNAAEGGDTIRGDSASKGVVTGIVRVIATKSEFGKLAPGEILVTGMTRPEFVPLMKIAGGIVTDEGGITSHAAIVSRELNKPCVIGTKIATRMLKDGDLVEVDATHGTIRVLKPSRPALLSKMFTRAHSLFYISAWRTSNCERAAEWLGENVAEVFYVREGESPDVDVWYSEANIEEYRNDIRAKIESDPTWFDTLSSAFSSEWDKLMPFITKGEPLTIPELEAFYRHWVNWWEPMAIMMQIPEVPGLVKDIIDRAYALRAETQEYSDDGDRIYLAAAGKAYPEHKAYLDVLLPSEVFSGSLPSAEVLSTRQRGWFYTCDRFAPISELAGALREWEFTLEDSVVLEKIYSRDTTIIMQELWGRLCSHGAEERFGKVPEAGPSIVHVMHDGSIEIWENTRATNRLMDAVLRKNQEDSGYLPALLSQYEGKLARLDTFWKRETLGSADELSEYVSLAEDALNDFIPYYYSAVDERTPHALRELALSMREKDEFFAKSDTLIRSSLLRLYPHIAGYETAVLRSEIGDVPDIETLRDRRTHMTLTDGVDATIETISELSARHPDIRLVQDATDGQATEISGQIAFAGYAKGPARILRRRDQMVHVQEGDIIVSPMTTPDFLPAMQKAAAFVTDEGGITCHAGIVAREMKKPCVIGTKIATQVIGDGDIVEVQAETGVVRILERTARELPSSDDYVFTFASQGTSFLFEDICCTSYMPPDSYELGHDGKVETYAAKATIESMGAYGKSRTADDTRKVIKEIIEAHKAARGELDTYRSKAEFTRDDTRQMFNRIHELFRHYYYFDFWNWEQAFRSAPENEQDAENVALIGEYKNKFRADLDPICFTEDGYMPTLLKRICEVTGIARTDLDWYREEEVYELFEGNNVSSDIMDARKEAYALYKDREGNASIRQGKDARGIIKSLTYTAVSGTDTLQGVVAHGHGGKVRGRVSRIHRDYADPSVLKRSVEHMHAGDILVSESTDPELIEAMRKSSAVITDVGGMLSHAAITCREFDIPCIVGTQTATRLLEEGELVELDLDTGSIRRIRE